MSPPDLQRITAAIAARGRITAEDVIDLRRAVYEGAALVDADEIEALFALEEACSESAPEWTEFFCEAVTDFIVHQERPHGWISDANALWLERRILRDGVVGTKGELEVVVRVLEKAEVAPASLSAFALRQVAAAVLDGRGPLARGRSLEPGAISADEVELLRRVLYAFGSHGRIAVTREEAEVLFDLNDRSREADNHPSWSDLFVKAVANMLMAARGYQVPTREEALRREAWLDAPTAGVSGILGSVAAGLVTGSSIAALGESLRAVWGCRRRCRGDGEPCPECAVRDSETEQAARNRAVEAEIAVAERVDSDEVRWLAERIGRDGVLHDNERALLDFLRDESTDIHPSLRTLLDTAA